MPDDKPSTIRKCTTCNEWTPIAQQGCVHCDKANGIKRMSDTSGNGAAASGGALKGLGTLVLLGAAYYIFFVQPNPVDVVASAVDNANSSASANKNAFSEHMAEEEAAKYEMMNRNNVSAMDHCLQAGLVASNYLDAQNEEKYKFWLNIKKMTCKAAGM